MRALATHDRTQGWVADRLTRWIAVDWATAIYAMFVAILSVLRAPVVPEWPYLVLAHALLVMALLLLPERGAAWERAQPGEVPWRSRIRAVGRFLRYTYPAVLLTPFFEEVALTVNAVASSTPYWFERFLYAADRALFGGIPAVMLSQAGRPIVDEVMHAFYFSYYPLIIGGIILAWKGRGRWSETPARGFHTAFTCMLLGFFLSYVWYPFLPARGPWENAQIMADLRPFGGWLFTPLIGVIIDGAAVSGGCFPSAHVSGTWALTFGLYATHRRLAFCFGLVAVGLSVACVYTRYHHGVDVIAGITVAAIATVIGRRLTRQAGNA